MDVAGLQYAPIKSIGSDQSSNEFGGFKCSTESRRRCARIQPTCLAMHHVTPYHIPVGGCRVEQGRTWQGNMSVTWLR